MTGIHFETIDWSLIPSTVHLGTSGEAYWQTLELPALRVRLVRYSKGYAADHWCRKGHIVHCLEGAFVSELQSGERFVLKAGMSYIVSDDLSTHRSVTADGATLLIID